MDRRAASYREFWPLYLAEHGRPATRGLHYLGTGLGLIMLAAAAFFRDWRLLIVALFVGYGFAWLGHAFVERNRMHPVNTPLWIKPRKSTNLRLRRPRDQIGGSSGWLRLP